MPIWEIIFFPQMFHREEIQPLGGKQDSPFSCSRDFAAGGNQAPRCAQAGELGRGRGERQELFFRLNRYGVGSSEPAGDRPRVTLPLGPSGSLPQVSPVLSLSPQAYPYHIPSEKAAEKGGATLPVRWSVCQGCLQGFPKSSTTVIFF